MASGGALTLLLAFGLLAGPEGGYSFEAIRRVSASGVGPIVLLLALLGAGSKAGLVPLHAWLPLAHPAAPSHVSALMSGVMTKVAVYGFVRLVFDLAGPPAWWWSVPVLVIAAVTALLGVLYALMEHDLKRLLAYHTVQNIRSEEHTSALQSRLHLVCRLLLEKKKNSRQYTQSQPRLSATALPALPITIAPAPRSRIFS